MAAPAADKQLRALSRASAIIIPLLLVAAVVYATWVLVPEITVAYLMKPSKNLQAHGIHPRRGPAIAILVIYFILLPFMALPYLRIIQVIWTDPGYIPLGKHALKASASTKEFERLDAFICEPSGLPIYCDQCQNFKPDRTHHCSELGRCVPRMDHFCPWVGGIVCENNHKFFLQFCFFGTLYTSFLLITLAVLLAERHKKVSDMPTTWIVAVALAGLFFLFACGMFASSFDLALHNFTTIENLQKGVASHCIAIFNRVVPREENPTVHSYNNGWHRPGKQPYEASETVWMNGRREYKIVRTAPGEHPWDLGWKKNLQDLMGYTLFDWILPIKYSPFTDHFRTQSHFEFGPVVDKAKKDHDIVGYIHPNYK